MFVQVGVIGPHFGTIHHTVINGFNMAVMRICEIAPLGRNSET
jgi:hypothetical protein